LASLDRVQHHRKKFFERQGFVMLQAQRVEHNGQIFENYAMEKRIVVIRR